MKIHPMTERLNSDEGEENSIRFKMLVKLSVVVQPA